MTPDDQEKLGNLAIHRQLHGLIDTALCDTRVVGIVGPRQAGKSTLVQRIIGERPSATYVTLDDGDVRELASADPRGFVDGRRGLLAIDEVQRVPELILAIKASVDRDQRPGRFLITGSSQLNANREVSETLAGRIERHTLWPFSQGELRGQQEQFIARLFAGQLPEDAHSRMEKRDYLTQAVAGGFPEALARQGPRRRAWFDAYVQTVVERETPGVLASPRTADLPRLLRLVAARHAGILNVSDLAADAQLPRTTVARYLDVLEAVFLITRTPAWAANLSQREIRAPKVFVTDSGLAAHLRRAEVDVLERPELARGADGPIIEGFVVAELLRQASWAPDPPWLSHYRDRNGTEVDIVIEAPDGRIAAVEIKAGSGATAPMMRHLATVRDLLGERFVAGVALHTGPTGGQVGDRLFSLPIDVLWS